MAQKANVKLAKSKMTGETPDYAAARAAIQQALVDPETKDLADTWFQAGMIGYNQCQKATMDQVLGQAVDKMAVGEGVAESYMYWLKADSIALIPTLDKKGREVIDTKTHSAIQKKMLEYYTNQELIKYGIELNDQRDFKRAYEIFSMHLDIPELPMMQDEKLQAKMPKDTIFQQYMFYKGIFAIQSGMHPEAVKALELLKDGDYEPVQVNQFLYQEYVELKDTASYVALLQNASKRFPQEPWFLQNLINHYIFSNQMQTAIEYLQQAIEREPKVTQYHIIMGNILNEQGEYDNAIACYHKALEIDPQLAAAVAGEGRVYFDRATKLNEKSMNISDDKLYKQALQEMNTLFKKSLPLFERAHEMDPKNRDYMQILRQLYGRFQMEAKRQAIIEELENL